MKILLATEGSD